MARTPVPIVFGPVPSVWQLSDRAAEDYEAWYATPSGRRAARAEEELLARLLEPFPGARSVLEVGCGTGHFTAWLAGRGLRTAGLDRAPAMLAELRRRLPECPVVRADAHALPFADRAFDLVVFVTTLEFLDSPQRALAEAARAARLGIVAIALNRWSVGGLSRRRGPQSRSALRRHARDLSLRDIRRLFESAAATRPAHLRWRSALLPGPLPPGPTAIPLGDVIGVAADLTEPGPGTRVDSA
jgi:ubiquinone/menaquinone biosynthesis C-methylase UbiE